MYLCSIRETGYVCRMWGATRVHVMAGHALNCSCTVLVNSRAVIILLCYVNVRWNLSITENIHPYLVAFVDIMECISLHAAEF